MKVKLTGEVISVVYKNSPYGKCIEFHVVVVDEDTRMKHFVKCKKSDPDKFMDTINIGDVIKLKGVTIREENRYGCYIESKKC